jgi:hypothetical protein
MALQVKEIQLLLKKLRDRYADHARRHNRAWFNVESFEERYRMALEGGMNMEAFILAEIANFEKIKEKYEKKRSEKPFSAMVDRIMEGHAERMKKYPAVYFHPMADLEITHFYGALRDFALYELPALRPLLTEPRHKDRLTGMEETLSVLALPLGKKHARRILDHMLVLSRPPDLRSDLDVERDKSAYLRESAFLLHEISDFCAELLELRPAEWELPLRFDKFHLEESRKKNVISRYSGLSGYGAILRLKEKADSIIQDFRLSAFRGPVKNP